MDWRSITFDWNRARAFLVTAEEGSLSAAARALGMNQPTLGRQVAALEQELGVALFERVGRGLELTPGGLDLLAHVRDMGDAANSFSLAATGRADSLEGLVSLSATEVMAAHTLPQILLELRQVEPGIELELIASNSTSDLKRREADIAIRAFRPTQPDLIARKLRPGQGQIYAASAYLDRIGRVDSPSGYAAADFIGFDRGNRFREFLNGLGFELDAGNFPLSTENHLVNWQLVKAGLGIGVMPIDVGDATPGVERILPDLDPVPYEQWLVVHRELRTSRRIRRVFDFLAERLGRDGQGA